MSQFLLQPGKKRLKAPCLQNTCVQSALNHVGHSAFLSLELVTKQQNDYKHDADSSFQHPRTTVMVSCTFIMRSMGKNLMTACF